MEGREPCPDRWHGLDSRSGLDSSPHHVLLSQNKNLHELCIVVVTEETLNYLESICQQSSSTVELLSVVLLVSSVQFLFG